MQALVHADFVNRDDVRMLQTGSRLSLDLKPLDIVVSRQSSGHDHLDRDDASECGLSSLVDDPHSAARDFLQQFVVAHVTELLPRPQGLSQRVTKTADRFGPMVHAVSLTEELTQVVGQLRMGLQKLATIGRHTRLAGANVVGDHGLQLLVVVRLVAKNCLAGFRHRRSSLLQQAVQSLQSPEQQARHGRFGAAHLGRDLGQLQTLQMVQHDRLALRVGQCRQCLRQPQQVFLFDGALTGRRLHGGQPVVRAREGRVDRSFQRLLATDITLVPPLIAQSVGQIVLQYLAQPRRPFRFAGTAKLVSLGERIRQRLLNDVRRIELRRATRIDVSTSQQDQVRPMPLQPLSVICQWLIHVWFAGREQDQHAAEYDRFRNRLRGGWSGWRMGTLARSRLR